jgi:hypothetical protein
VCVLLDDLSKLRWLRHLVFAASLARVGLSSARPDGEGESRETFEINQWKTIKLRWGLKGAAPVETSRAVRAEAVLGQSAVLADGVSFPATPISTHLRARQHVSMGAKHHELSTNGG